MMVALLSKCTGSDPLVVSFSSRSRDTSNPIKFVSFCLGCPTPAQEGSIIQGLLPKFGLSEFTATGELVYCVPNHAEMDQVYNEEQLENKIVLVERGKNSFLEKIDRLQQLDISGIIIADDGRCNEQFTQCGYRIGSVADGGFAAFDEEKNWNEVDIPVILISLKSAEKLRKLMALKEVEVSRLGKQYITITDDMEFEL